MSSEKLLKTKIEKMSKFLPFFAVFFVLIMSGIFSAQTAYAGTLTISITADAATCTSGGGTVLLRMSGATNAHAELPSQANYAGNVVCGNNVTGLGNACTGTTATILKLSGTGTNSHVEDKSLSNYANSACISVSSGSVSTGTTTSTCVSAGYDATIGSMSGNTNAHVGDSTAYTTKICATATGSNPPTLTSYTNDTETDTAFDYATSCTTCGARIGGGSGFRQSVTITGTNFGADPGAGNRSTATNNIKVGSHQASTTNVTAWSDTSITFLTDSNVAGDTDPDWGADFGGASALTVTAGGSASGGLNFYVFPQITSLTTCDKTGFPTGDGAREYDATDSACPNGLKDGQIKLNGTRFGTGSTGGYTQILGCDASTCTSPTGTVNIDSWSNTLIQAQVPSIISNSVYTGGLVMKQGTGSNNKMHTYTPTGFRIFPRIASPSNASVGDPITINGDHLCQAGAASCPTAFGSSDDIVVFTSYATSTVFTSWNNTAIVTVVPTGTVTGNVVVTSSTRISNGASFTVVSSTPSDPTSLGQFKNIGLTQPIGVGGIASSTPIYLSMTMQAGASGGTLYPQTEHKTIGTGFACIGTSACGSATEGIGWAGPGPTTGTTSVSVSDGVYHWQARVRHNKNSVDYYSAWVSFDSGNPESSTDFKVDMTAPAITNISSGSPGTNSATITWDTTGELSTSQVQYNTTGSFVDNCATNNDCTILADTPPDTNGKMAGHSVSLSNLNSGTTYYYRVRSKDVAGNESISSNSSFITGSVSQPAKTTLFHIVGTTTPTTYSNPGSYTFSVFMPETSPSIKNMFVVVTGVYNVPAASAASFAVQVNAESSKTYTLPSLVSKNHFKIFHKVNAINIDPSTNTLTITPSNTNTEIYVSSADIVVQYGYTP